MEISPQKFSNEETLINKEGEIIEILHLNIQCLSNKILALECYLLHNTNVKIVCLNEHWLRKDHLSCINLGNYVLASYYCRDEIKNGGSCIFVHPEIKTYSLDKVVTLSKPKICEISACCIRALNLVVISVYRSTEQKNVDTFVEIMSKALDIVTVIGKEINVLVTGDYNVHFNNIIDGNVQCVKQLF